jgi:hypothetical protein
MRTRAWCTTVVLAILAVACGDQPTEVVPEREVTQAPGMIRGPGMTVNATSSSDDGLSITTDKDDYQPGDTVYFSGAGWPANDVLDIVLTDEPQTHPPLEWTVNVGEDGTFADSTYVVDEGDVDVTFTLLTTSRATERWLSVTFTDANITNNVSLNPNPVSVPRGSSGATTVTVSFGGNTTNCTSPLSIANLQAGTTGSFAPTSVTGNSNDTPKTSTLTITTTAASPLGPDVFTVTAGTPPGSGCDGVARTVNGTVIVFGPAAKLAFQQQPPATAASASAFTPAVAVSVLDASNNVVANSSATITLAIGTNPGGGILSGTLTQNAVNGVATFPGLSIDKAGNGYTLTASSGALTGATSNTFNITPGPAAKLVFSVQPSGGTPNTAFPTQPVVQVQDAAGNVKTSGVGSTASVLLAVTPGTGSGFLTCTTNPRAAVAGVATFAGCRINLAGTNYKLRATSAGLTLDDSDPFDITPNNQAPAVDAGSYTVVEGTELTLAPIVSDPDAGDVLTYKWTVNPTGIDTGGDCSFDDDTKKNAKITCTDDSQGGPGGKFTLTLEVNDGNGHTVSDNADLTVSNANPVANAGGPYSGNEGSAIQLSGAGDDPGNNDDPQLGYQWTVVTTGIDAGGTCSFDNAASKNAKVTCTDDGSFKVRLVVGDDDGGTSAASEANLTVANAGPVAESGGPYNGSEGSPVQLNGTVTDAGSNDTHVWLWKYVAGAGLDGGTCSFDNENAQDPKITCTDDGTVELTLKVTDDDADDSEDTATLTLANVDPVANAGGSYNGNEGSPVPLNGSVTDAGTNDSHTWSWEYVGTNVDPGATCSISNPNAEDPTITCTDDGTVQLTLTVTDDDGGSDTDEATLTLENVDPVATSGGPYSGNEGAAIQLTGTATDAGSNDVLTKQWTYAPVSGVDAGASCSFSPNAAALTPTVTCTDDGTFKLTLTVTDDDLGSDAADATLTLANVDPVATAGGPYSGNEGAAISLTGMKSDAGSNDGLTQQWTWAPVSGVDVGATCSFSPNAAALSPTVTCTDDGSYQLTLTVSDDDGGSGTSNANLTVANVAPVLTALTAPDGTALPTSIIVAGTLNIKTTFGDQGSNDSHTAQLDCGTGPVSLGASATSPVTASCTFATIGPKTIQVTVTDDDGGYDVETHNILVKYNFDGFYAPVDRPNTMNVSKAGQAIPLKWRLTDANGTPVSDVVAVTIRAKDLGCATGATTDLLEEYASGASGLQNQGDGRYQFNWKTPSTYAGSCKTIELVFGTGGLSYVDGPHAYFSFKK